MTDKPCVFNLFCNLRVFIKECVTNPTPKTLVWDPTPRFSILGVGRAKSRKIEAKSAWDRPEDGCHSPLPKFRSGRLEERANIRAYKTCVQAQRPEFRKSHVTTLSVAGGAL